MWSGLLLVAFVALGSGEYKFQSFAEENGAILVHVFENILAGTWAGF